MRVDISLDDLLVRDLDRRVGSRDRTEFISQVLRSALDEPDRYQAIEAVIGSVRDNGDDGDDGDDGDSADE